MKNIVRNLFKRRKLHERSLPLPCFEFAEWVGENYVRLNNVWVHRFSDQRDSKNWKTSEQLYDYWKDRLRLSDELIPVINCDHTTKWDINKRYISGCDPFETKE